MLYAFSNSLRASSELLSAATALSDMMTIIMDSTIRLVIDVFILMMLPCDFLCKDMTSADTIQAFNIFLTHNTHE